MLEWDRHRTSPGDKEVSTTSAIKTPDNGIAATTALPTGYRTACHWASREQLGFFGVEPVAARVVFDRNRVSGGGVTAGTDFALAPTAAIRGGENAKFVQLSLEYDPHPPFDSGLPKRADPATLATCRAMIEKFAPGRADKVRAIAERLAM